MSRVACLNHVYILNFLAALAPFGIESDLRVRMPSTSSALYVLDKGVIKIKSAGRQPQVSVFRRIALIPDHQITVWYIESFLCNGSVKLHASDPVRPRQWGPYKAVELPFPKLHQSDDLLSKGYVDIADFTRVGTNQDANTEMLGSQACEQVS